MPISRWTGGGGLFWSLYARPQKILENTYLCQHLLQLATQGCVAGAKACDVTCLVSYLGSQFEIVVDQGKDDKFLSDEQLNPGSFTAVRTGWKSLLFLGYK